MNKEQAIAILERDLLEPYQCIPTELFGLDGIFPIELLADHNRYREAVFNDWDDWTPERSAIYWGWKVTCNLLLLELLETDYE